MNRKEVYELGLRMRRKLEAQAIVAARSLGAEVELTPEIINLATEDAPITELSVGQPWRAGVRVSVGMITVYNGIDYECRQAHVTQSDWTPDKTPALWAVKQKEPETGTDLAWIAGENVKAGDVRVYNGQRYSCVQGHTTQAGWTPSAVPALWKKI